MSGNPFRYFKTSREVIQLAVLMSVRYPLSLRNVEDLLNECGIEVSHESIRFWAERFGPYFARQIRRTRTRRMELFTHWRWHVDEVVVKINGKRRYLWCAVDHEGEVLESFVTKAKGKLAALTFLKKATRRKPWSQTVFAPTAWPCRRSAIWNVGRWAGIWTTELKTSICRSDDESGRCCGSEG
jgi:putative transposase